MICQDAAPSAQEGAFDILLTDLPQPQHWEYWHGSQSVRSWCPMSVASLMRVWVLMSCSVSFMLEMRGMSKLQHAQQVRS